MLPLPRPLVVVAAAAAVVVAPADVVVGSSVDGVVAAVVVESPDGAVSSGGTVLSVPALAGDAPMARVAVRMRHRPGGDGRPTTTVLSGRSCRVHRTSFVQSRRRWARRNASTVAVVQQRLPSLLDPPIGFAHRGARDRAPENTIEAFRTALELGATGLESDVWLTADGVAVLDHDGVVRVGRRRKSIGTCLAEDLPDHIPTLAQLFEHCGVDFHLSLDLKDVGIGGAVIEVVASAAATC